MTRIHGMGPADPGALERRLLAAADRAGNADGLVGKAELARLVKQLESRPPASFDRDAEKRLEVARRLLSEAPAQPLSTLEPALRSMPEAVRRLALEIDALWGDADGQVQVEELDRVARYYLAVLPYFSAKAEDLLALASLLKLGSGADQASASGVVALRAAVAKLDSDQASSARPFGELFGEALQAAEIPGAPGLLREALQHSPRWHRLSILEHTAAATEAAHALAEAAGVDWQEAGATLLLHDVGKLLSRHAKERHGELRFYYWDHEEVGARWLKQRQVPAELLFQIQNHLEIHRREAAEIIDLAGGDPARVARMLVVAAADSLGKGDTSHYLESWAKLQPRFLELAAFAGLDGPAMLAETERLRTVRFSNQS